MNNKIHFLGIDIGGAHIKIVGLNKDKKINFIDYRKCYIWKGLKQLDNEIRFINSLVSNKNILCGLTTTAELCDIFSDRKKGGEIIFENVKKLNLINIFIHSKKKNFKGSVLSFQKQQSHELAFNWRVCEKQKKRCPCH